MTERDSMEPFETRFAERVRAYTQVATTRDLDPLQVSRDAMSARPADRRSLRHVGSGLFGRPIVGDRWAAVAVAALLIGVVAIAVQGRPSNSRVGGSTPGPSATAGLTVSPGGAIPDALRHPWQRPSPVAPGPDPYGSGFLDLTGESLELGHVSGVTSSRSTIAVADPDTLLVTATRETQECVIGDSGAYHWIVEGSGTVLTLSPISSDACSARERALAGPWVRSDLPAHPVVGTTMAPGTYTTSAFDPLGDPGLPSRLRYTLPAGWQIDGDDPGTFVLHHDTDVAPGKPPAVMPALLPAALAGPTLARMERRGYDPFLPVEIAPWRRQWLIWRAARNPDRIAG